MNDMMAVVSKSVFEKEARGLKVGDLYETSRYRSKNKALAKLGTGGRLFLVTVRPGDVLWLVAILKGPKQSKEGWAFQKNRHLITDVGHCVAKLRFSTGKGVSAKPGRLGMSLQTPRGLTTTDVELLLGEAGDVASKDSSAKATPAKAAPAKAAPAKAAKATRVKAAKVTRVKPAKATQSKAGASSLEALLARWSDTRAPAIADAIAAVGPSEESPTATSLRARKKIPQKEWLELADGVAVADRGALLATLVDAPAAKVKERIEHIKSWGDDPRICDALHEIIRQLPWVSTGTRSVWTLIFKRLVVYRDSRTIVVARAFRPEMISSSWSGPADWMSARLEKLASSIEKMPPAELPETEIDALLELTERVGSPSRQSTLSFIEEHFEAVYRDSNDDEAKLVLADVLLEVGDVRGELITLQHQEEAHSLSKEQQKRVKAIITEHADHLLGALARWSMVRGRKFRLGFVHSCILKERIHAHGLAELAADPRMMPLVSVTGPLQALVLPNLRCIRRARVNAYYGAELEIFLESPRQLERLECFIRPTQVYSFEKIAAHLRLRSIGLCQSPTAVFEPFLKSEACSDIDEIFVRVGTEYHPEFERLSALQKAWESTNVPRFGGAIESETGAWSIEAFLDRQGGLRVIADVKSEPKYGAATFLAAAFSLNRSLDEITVCTPRPVRDSVRRGFERLAAEHAPGLTSLSFEVAEG